jgi:lipopolysaccharide export system ATP-binding protein
MLTLRTDNLIKRYKGRTVVNNVSIQVKQGEIVGLLGPNGAGKTTTFYMTVGLIKPNEGKIFLENTEITNEPMYKRAQMGIGYLAQEASVFRKLSVEDNIKAVLEMTNKSQEEQEEKLEVLLNEFSLQKIRKSRGEVLSGEKEEEQKLQEL